MDHTVVHIFNGEESYRNPCYVIKCEKCNKDTIQKNIVEYECFHSTCAHCSKNYRFKCPICSSQKSNSYIFSYITNYINDIFYKNRVKPFVDDLPSSEQMSV